MVYIVLNQPFLPSNKGPCSFTSKYPSILVLSLMVNIWCFPHTSIHTFISKKKKNTPYPTPYRLTICLQELLLHALSHSRLLPSLKNSFSHKSWVGSSQVVQWLGICLAVLEMWVRSLVGKQISHTEEQLSPSIATTES